VSGKKSTEPQNERQSNENNEKEISEELVMKLLSMQSSETEEKEISSDLPSVNILKHIILKWCGDVAITWLFGEGDGPFGEFHALIWDKATYKNKTVIKFITKPEELTHDFKGTNSQGNLMGGFTPECWLVKKEEGEKY